MADKNLEKTDKRYHESFFKKLLNQLLIIFLKGISFLPFWVIYGISDFLYVLIRFVVGYRKKVITENLRCSFPEKTDDEIKQIRNKFYRHFCDLWLETIKMHTIGRKSMAKHFQVEGIEKLNNYFEEGRSVVFLTVHYNNWEWQIAMQPFVKHLGLVVYNPIRGNQAMENFLTHSRERWGAKCIPVHISGREIMKYNLQGQPTLAVLAADQTPPPSSKFWTMFLNREAPFFSGPERIAIRGNQPVLFVHAKKVKRGFYKAEIVELVAEPKNAEPKDILLGYVRKTEEVIREQPEFYLWSHRRWKHKRPEGVELTV